MCWSRVSSYDLIFFLMIRRPPRSTLFPYTNALPIFGLEPGPVAQADFTGASGARATHELLDQPEPPTAIIYANRSEEHTSELQSRRDLVCRLLLEKKKKKKKIYLT